MFQRVQIKSFYFYSYFKQFKFPVSNNKLNIPKDDIIKPLWRNIYKRLQSFHDEQREIEKHLYEKTEKMNLENLRVRLNDIQPIVALHEKYTNVFKGLEELKEMAKESHDAETKQFIKDEQNNYKNLLIEYAEKAIDFLLPQNKFDDCMSINFEIRPGVGGSESALFAEDLFLMYQNFCAMNNWNYKVTQFTKDFSIGKGCKCGMMKISGSDVYKKLRCESGVHKVIRVPETESKGRLHSSVVSVVILPHIPMDFRIDEKDLKFEYMRASGAGGQHVNKTDSACRVTHIPTGMAVHNQESRTQDKNRKNAIEILTNKLFILEVDRANSFFSSQRKDQMASSDRSDKIRTYNFPQDRITDHRTNITLFGIPKMLNGEYLEQFIEEFEKKQQNEKLKALMEDLNE